MASQGPRWFAVGWELWSKRFLQFQACPAYHVLFPVPDKASLRVWIFKYGDVYLYLKCSSLTVALSAALCQEETQLPFLQVWVLGPGKRAFHMLHESSLASIGNPEVETG